MLWEIPSLIRECEADLVIEQSSIFEKQEINTCNFYTGGGYNLIVGSTLNDEKGDMKNMKNVKKYLAFSLAVALMLSSTVAYAAESNSSSSGSSSVSDNSTSKSLSSEEKAVIAEAREKAEAERIALAEASREAVRMESEAAGEGFENAAQMQYAQAANKSAGEYYNNAVSETQGIEEATPVAQGGNLVVDGKVTNMTASISKVPAAFVDSVRAAQEGTVLNVVDIQFPAAEATINFYMPGVAAGANIAAVQYVDGAWVDVDVKEVRADHVVLDLKSNGIVAFLAK